MEEAGDQPFNISEMYVFGKYETFKKRIEKVLVSIIYRKSKELFTKSNDLIRVTIQ